MIDENKKTVVALKAHLALNVRNVENSTEFYRKMLGLEPSKVRRGYAKFDVTNPPLNLTLNEHEFTESGALSHLGIQVASTNDVFVLREQWTERGLLTRDEMQTDCCYALQDKTWVHDPDGNEWEVFAVLEDNLPETVSEVADNSACCAPAAATEKTTANSSCGCASAPSFVGQEPCCETQAVKFDVSHKQSGDVCCAPSPLDISR